jgi:hypothetical protein
VSRQPSPRLRDDIDPLAVEVALQGDRPTLNRGERRAAIAIMVLHQGRTSGEVARHLGLTVHMVRRERQALGIAAPPHVHRAA